MTITDDLILDNQRGAAYFRPNAHLDAPYRNPERLVVRAGVVVGAVAAAIVIWRVVRRRTSQR